MIPEIIIAVAIAIPFFYGAYRYKKWHDKNKHKKNFDPNDVPFGGN